VSVAIPVAVDALGGTSLAPTKVAVKVVTVFGWSLSSSSQAVIPNTKNEITKNLNKCFMIKNLRVNRNNTCNTKKHFNLAAV
jgi:hypothetical protein